MRAVGILVELFYSRDAKIGRYSREEVKSAEGKELTKHILRVELEDCELDFSTYTVDPDDSMEGNERLDLYNLEAVWASYDEIPNCRFPAEEHVVIINRSIYFNPDPIKFGSERSYYAFKNKLERIDRELSKTPAQEIKEFLNRYDLKVLHEDKLMKAVLKRGEMYEHLLERSTIFG